MRDKGTPSSLMRFLKKREETDAISLNELQKDLTELVRKVRAIVGNEPEVNGALRLLMLQPLWQVAEELESIRRMGVREAGRQRIPNNKLGTTGVGWSRQTSASRAAEQPSASGPGIQQAREKSLNRWFVLSLHGTVVTP